MGAIASPKFPDLRIMGDRPFPALDCRADSAAQRVDAAGAIALSLVRVAHQYYGILGGGDRPLVML